MVTITEKQNEILKGLKFIDLFAGIGAFRLALESFGATCVFSSEIDKDARECYKENYGTYPAGDITQIKEKEIPCHDILCAGFPCQPFSISGNQQGFEDTRGTLFFEVARIIKYHKPKLVLLENVKNFITHDNGNTLNTVLNSLKELGYVVFYDLYDATDYGVPQKRERVFFVCFREDLGISNFQKPLGCILTKCVEDLLLNEEEATKYIIDRTDIEWLNNVDCYSKEPIRLGNIDKGCQGYRIYNPQGTGITLSAYGGGVGACTGLYLVNGKIRKLAPRECARLDGFLDTFKLPKSDRIAYKLFGNSIVVDVIQHIILEMDYQKIGLI